MPIFVTPSDSGNRPNKYEYAGATALLLEKISIIAHLSFGRKVWLGDRVEQPLGTEPPTAQWP
jgi:hypothetical protein